MVPARTLAAVALGVLVASCGGGENGSGRSSTTATASTRSSEPRATVTTAISTTSPPSTAPPYGSPCRAGSHPDCIDPEGDGEFEYLEGGADCLRKLGAGSGLCSDLDGDGRAGYPDSG